MTATTDNRELRDQHIATLEKKLSSSVALADADPELAPHLQPEIDAYRAAIALMRGQSEPCEWQKDDDEWEGEHWDSACGEKYFFVEGGPSDSGHKFCHGCGKPLHIIEPKDPADEQ